MRCRGRQGLLRLELGLALHTVHIAACGLGSALLVGAGFLCFGVHGLPSLLLTPRPTPWVCSWPLGPSPSWLVLPGSPGPSPAATLRGAAMGPWALGFLLAGIWAVDFFHLLAPVFVLNSYVSPVTRRGGRQESYKPRNSRHCISSHLFLALF